MKEESENDYLNSAEGGREGERKQLLLLVLQREFRSLKFANGGVCLYVCELCNICCDLLFCCFNHYND